MPLQFPRPRWTGLLVSEAKSDAESQSSPATVDVCRICWDTGDANDPLVSPCICKGSMRYIHLSCLRQWQDTQRADGQHAVSCVCGICHTRYRTDLQHRWRLRDKQKELASHCLEFSSAVMDMAASNPWKLVQRAFELGFFVNGLAQGSWCAGKGAGQAFRASTAAQLPTLKSLASWLPEIILGTAIFKPLQVPILFSSAAFLLASAVEVTMYSAAGAYVGFLYGATVGTLRMLRWSYASTVRMPLKTLAWVLGGTVKASGQLCSLYNSRGQVVSFLAQVALIKVLFKGR